MSLAAVIVVPVICALLLGVLCEWLTWRPIQRIGTLLLEQLPCGAKVFDMASEGTAVASLKGAPAGCLDQNVDPLSKPRMLVCSQRHEKCHACPWLHAERKLQAVIGAGRSRSETMSFSEIINKPPVSGEGVSASRLPGGRILIGVTEGRCDN